MNLEQFTPKDWPAGAPDYFSAAGWEFEKRLTEMKILERFGPTFSGKTLEKLYSHYYNQSMKFSKGVDHELFTHYTKICTLLIEFKIAKIYALD